MEWRQYSLTERVFLVEFYFRSFAVSGDGCPCLGWVRDSYSARFHRSPPPHSLIVRLVDAFRSSGSVLAPGTSETGGVVTSRVRGLLLTLGAGGFFSVLSFLSSFVIYVMCFLRLQLKSGLVLGFLSSTLRPGALVTFSFCNDS